MSTTQLDAYIFTCVCLRRTNVEEMSWNYEHEHELYSILLYSIIALRRHSRRYITRCYKRHAKRTGHWTADSSRNGGEP